MARQTSKVATVALLVLSLCACATASSPWAAHHRSADLKALYARPMGVCAVVVQNGTDQVLDAVMERSGEPLSLGLLGVGQSVSLGVACADRRVAASAVVVDPDMLESGRTLRTSALLDLARETRLRFTASGGTGR